MFYVLCLDQSMVNLQPFSETEGQLVGAEQSKSGKNWWRDKRSFKGRNFCRTANFCPIYFVLPQLTAPGSPRMISN